MQDSLRVKDEVKMEQRFSIHSKYDWRSQILQMRNKACLAIFLLDQLESKGEMQDKLYIVLLHCIVVQ